MVKRHPAIKALNAELGKLAQFIENKEIWAIAQDRNRDKEFYKEIIEEFKGKSMWEKKEEKTTTLQEAFREFIHFHESPTLPSSEKLGAGTIKTYKTGLNFLSSTLHGDFPLTEIDMAWYRSFVKRAEIGGTDKEHLSTNYIGKLVKLVKRVLRFAESRGHEVNPAFRSREFKVLSEEVTHIYLTEDEIGLFRALDLRKTPSLADTRDLFVLGCYTGLRYSDFSKLTDTDIKEVQGIRMFEVRSKKTDVRVSIPVHPLVEGIIASRNGSLPPYQSDQVMNRNLKRLGKLVGLHERVEVERTEGGTRNAQIKPKYELIHTHTARRSFCTNAYLQGLDTLDIMAISGHKTETSFLKYIKVTREQRAKRIAQHPFFAS